MASGCGIWHTDIYVDFVLNFTPKSLFLGVCVGLGRVGANRARHVPQGGFHPACLCLTPKVDHHSTKAQKRGSQSWGDGYEGLNLDPELYSVCKAGVPRVRWEEKPQTLASALTQCVQQPRQESHLQQDDRQELTPKVVVGHVLWQAYVCMYTRTQTDDRHTMHTYITHIHSERN